MSVSGVMVPTMMRSISAASIPAFSSAFLAAPVARSEVFSPSAAMCLDLIPVRVVIHSSVVSTMLSRSLLVMTLSGR